MQDAENALTTAQNETTRTPVATALCKTAFEILTAAMRDIKKRYFLSPPLGEADYVSLGLKPHAKRLAHRASQHRNLIGAERGNTVSVRLQVCVRT